jgi:hypothetical protein
MKTWLYWLNLIVLQWTCWRLCRFVDDAGKTTGWGILGPVAPLSGWRGPFRWFGATCFAAYPLRRFRPTVSGRPVGLALLVIEAIIMVAGWIAAIMATTFNATALGMLVSGLGFGLMMPTILFLSTQLD